MRNLTKLKQKPQKYKRKRQRRIGFETVLLFFTCLLVIFTITLYAWPVMADHLSNKLENLVNSNDSGFLDWLSGPDEIVKERVSIEAGYTDITPQLFLVDPAREAFWQKGTAVPDGRKTGMFTVYLQIEDKVYTSVLTVEDKTAPEVETRDRTIWQNEPLTADAFIAAIHDNTSTTVDYKISPDLTMPGTQTVYLLVTDEAGNQTEAHAQLNINIDTEPPVISGAQDLTVFTGDRIAYREGISAVDNKDGDVAVEIDSSQVNLRQEGRYPVHYSAADKAGNRSEITITVTVRTPVPEGIDEQALYALADQVLEEITQEDMTQTQIAQAIYNYTRSHIRYVNESDKSNWLLGADHGLREQYGDCFNYFAVAKLLLTRADIENVDVLKTGGGHYWSLVNLGHGWYHFDTTPRLTGGEFFMLTDAELTAYSQANGDSHIWDASLYPKTAQTTFTG